MASTTRNTPRSKRRARGAFYTPSSAAEFMAAWALEESPRTILEPSFGDGMFLGALRKTSLELRRDSPRVIGVEIDDQVFARTVASGVLQPSDAILSDFLQLTPFDVDTVIGNPPFVRLRHMSASEAAAAMTATAAQMGFEMDPSGSLWMPFVVHASAFVRRGGRLALVLPFDATYVRYARPLWIHLASQFGELRVIRSQERVFPDIMQDVVILMASNKGATCNTVRYKAYRRVVDLLSDSPEIEADLPITDVARGRRPFMWAHVKPELKELLDNKISPYLALARDLARFNIGYVAGDKTYFHPSTSTQSEFGLQNESLIRTINSSRNLRGAGLFTSQIPEYNISNLFFPANGKTSVSDSDLGYIRHGELLGVDQRYKCRVREPWYMVPYVKSPHVLLTAFTECPILVVNDERVAASNSLLCGYLNGVDPRDFAARWYTSLTRLHIETEVHSLGGGVMILVPREAGSIRVVDHPDITQAGLGEVDRSLSAGDAERAYQVGDETVLKRAVGLTDTEVGLLRDGIATLAEWRTAWRPKNGISS